MPKRTPPKVKAKWKKLPRICAVLWIDASKNPDETHPLPIPVPTITVGFVAEDTSDRSTLVMEVFADGDMRDKTSIPRGMILRTLLDVKITVPIEFAKYDLARVLRGTKRPQWPGYAGI